MGAWSLSDGTTTVTFDVLRGDTGYEDERDLAVSVSLSGERFVHRGPLLPQTPKHSDCVFASATDFGTFRTLARSGSVLTLTDDLAGTFDVVVGKFTGVTKDTATRGTAPRWHVVVEWLGV